MKRFLTLFLCVLLSPTAASSKEVAGWELHYLKTDGGEANGCFMASTYQDGTRVSLVVMRDYSYALGLHNSSWGLKPGEKISVSAYVDRRVVANTQAEVLQNGIAIIPLAGYETFRSLQAGYRLDLITSRGNVNFMLHGTAKAMTAVLACANELATRVTRSTPAASRSTPVSAADATVVLTNLLNAARMVGYKLKGTVAGKDVVLFSLPDGSAGSFFAFTGDTLSADEAAGIVISSDAEKCDGQFLSGKQSVASTDGSVVRKVVTTCRSGVGALVNETTLVRRPNGFLFNLTFSRPEADTLAPADGSAQRDARDKSILDAVFTLEK